MADLNGFDAMEVEPNGDFEPIPAGKYLAVITDSELKPTKAGTGSFLELSFQILDGEFENRMLWARFNLYNPNIKAVEIARGELSAICRAVGVHTPQDSTDLHNLPLIIKVKLRKRQDTEELVNEIRGYYAKDEPEEPQAVAAGASDDTPPWTNAS